MLNGNKTLMCKIDSLKKNTKCYLLMDQKNILLKEFIIIGDIPLVLRIA